MAYRRWPANNCCLTRIYSGIKPSLRFERSMRIVQILAFLAFVLPFAAPAAAQQPQSQQAKPNILFIAIDDLRDWVHYLGYEQVKTPNLDRVAARSVTFT